MTYRAFGLVLVLVPGCGLVSEPRYTDASVEEDVRLDVAVDGAIEPDAGEERMDAALPDAALLDAALPDAARLDAEMTVDAQATVDAHPDAGTHRFPVCGNGLVEAGETCDLGPAPV